MNDVRRMVNRCLKRLLDGVRQRVPRRFVRVMSVVLSLLAVVALALWWHESSHEQTIVLQQGHNLIELQFELIQRELELVRSDILYLAKQPHFDRLWDEVDDPSVRRAVESDYVRFAESKQVYDQIRVLDVQGREVLRVNYESAGARVVARDQLQVKADRYYYQQALSLIEGEVLLTPFDLNI